MLTTFRWLWRKLKISRKPKPARKPITYSRKPPTKYKGFTDEQAKRLAQLEQRYKKAEFKRKHRGRY